jgi:hypothetical protein|tara:strand:- start:87 stop:1223 length:1137 start_codon:yes stop_codon:yes gene_type:complete
MAFIDQVQDLTSLTVSDNDELSQFLKDGAIDVTNRWLAFKPQDMEQFARESAETTSNASLDLSGAKVISVLREDGVTSNNWRPCRKISIDQQHLVTDTDSLSFASKFHPVYMIGDNGKISVFPAPGADPNAFKAYYVNNSPEESDGSALRYTSTSIKYFPDDKVYLVIMYAGMKLLQAAMGATTISDLSITAVPPDTPTLSSTSVTITGIAPTYTAPVFTSASTYLTEMEAGTIGAAASDIDLEHWFSIAGQIIEDEEDIDLAQVHLQKIATFLNAFQMDVQNQLNIFNDANVEYQAELQKNLKDADFDNQEDARLIQKYQAELAVYQAEVGSQVQEYTQNLQADGAGYQWLMGQYAALKADYNAAFLMVAPKQQAPA